MLPSNRLSTLSVPGNFLAPDDDILPPLIARERGGIDLQDPSRGINFQNWTARYVSGEVLIGSETTAEQSVLVRANISELDLAFDQNMNPALAFTETDDNGITSAFLWWFDTTVNQYVFFEIPDAYDLRITMDDKRDLVSGTNDIILIYLRDDNLYFRVQRERFTIERLLRENINGRLKRFGMADNLRLQIEFLPFLETPDLIVIVNADDQYTVTPDFFECAQDDLFLIRQDATIASEPFDLVEIQPDVQYKIEREIDPCL